MLRARIYQKMTATSPKKGRRMRRRRLRPMDVEISFLEGLVRKDPEFIEAWEVLGDNYLALGRAQDGLVVDERLCELLPVDSCARYNLACSLAINGQFDRAALELALALDLGYRDFPHLAKDPELEQLRKHPSFRKVRAKITALTKA